MYKLLAAVCIAFFAWTSFEFFARERSDTDVARAFLRDKYMSLGEDPMAAKVARVSDGVYLTTPAAREMIAFRKLAADRSADLSLLTAAARASGHCANRVLMYAIISFDSRNSPSVSAAFLDASLRLAAANPISSEGSILEILDMLSERGDADNFIRFAEAANYSPDLALRVFACASGEKMVRRFLVRLKDQKEFPPDARLSENMRYAILSKSIPSWPIGGFEGKFRFCATQFKISWRLGEKWMDFKLPVLAYFSHLNGDAVKYAHFRDAAVSPKTLRDMAASYAPYVELSAKIFVLTGDIDLAARLIDTLPAAERAAAIRRCAPYFCRTSEGRGVLSKLVE